MTVRGVRKRISSQQAMLQRLFESAVRGDLRATKLFIALLERYLPRSLEPQKPAGSLERPSFEWTEEDESLKKFLTDLTYTGEPEGTVGPEEGPEHTDRESRRSEMPEPDGGPLLF
jgi:hypothetical protein